MIITQPEETLALHERRLSRRDPILDQGQSLILFFDKIPHCGVRSGGTKAAKSAGILQRRVQQRLWLFTQSGEARTVLYFNLF